MSKKVKRAISILIIVIVIIVAIIATYFIIKYLKNKNQINEVCENYSEDNIQEKLEDGDVAIDDLTMQINGETVIGVIKIEKINFEGLIYDGTSEETLNKGVGHFTNSPYLNGNVCLAAHNTTYWKKLYTLENGDKITYISFLGTKEYEVYQITEISQTDWSLFEDTDENILTLLTCVKGKSELRLCVQAKEVD